LATELLPPYLAGTIPARPQPTESPTPVTRMLTKADGMIDWSNDANEIERFIRAMNPWPMAWTDCGGTRAIIHAAHCEAGGLVIDQIQAAGKHIITGEEFARGYPNALTALEATGKVAPRNTHSENSGATHRAR